MKIVFCSSEVIPFAKTGGLADVCGTLPLALEQLGLELSIMLPGYGVIDRKKYGFEKLSYDLSRATIGKNLKVYLLEHAGFYARPGLYGNLGSDYPDNLQRFNFFCRRSVELLKDIEPRVDIVHCHDWQTGLIPAYLKTVFSSDPYYRSIKTIFSLHNLAYQGLFSYEEYKKLPFGDKVFPQIFEFYGKANLLKAGIVASDEVTTVSPQYAKEIYTKQFGCGLEGVLAARKKTIVGILNGIDYNEWDASKDRMIAFPYSPADLSGKAKNKAELQKIFKLPQRGNVPLFGFVNRLSHQKGIDLLKEVMPELMKLDVQLVFLGLGEEKYHHILNTWHAQYPQKISVELAFSEPDAHEVYAGSDIFLMPSNYEPCGLSQMIALRYGTVPLVFRTGGLVDTVVPHDQDGNGFVFSQYTAKAFLQILKEAVKVYHEPNNFRRLIQRGFESNFSWDTSAQQYKTLYEQCLTQ